jgi:serine/threonine protein kinase
MFKHDFFAATGLYQSPSGEEVVLKMGRTASLMGLPMGWVGEILARHEARIYQITESVRGIPRCLARYSSTGLVHEFVRGRPLLRGDSVGDQFFPRLSDLLAELHARQVAYVDLEKPENILLGEDGNPYLIDFQISWHLPDRRGGRTWLARWILDVLQRADRYHLLKHWRRLRPDQLDESTIAASYAAPFWIRWHRLLFRPLTHLRRWGLVWLGARSSAKGRSPG